MNLLSTLGKQIHARPVFWIVLLNLCVRGVWLYFVHPPQLYDFDWYYHHAVQMYEGGGYQWNGHYTAYWPIGYPFFLSMLFHLTGPSVIAGLVANALLSTGISVLVYLLAKACTHRVSIAVTAAVGYTALPSHIEWNAVLGSEALFTFLLMLSMYVYVRPGTGDSAQMGTDAAAGNRAAPALTRWTAAALSGLAMGFACDVRPIGLLFPVGVLIYEWLVGAGGVRRAIGKAAVYAAAMVVGILPVTIRNWLAMQHHLVLVSTNGGVNLWQGTHADGVYFWSWDKKVNPLLPYAHDEIMQNQVGMRAALQHITHHPLGTILHGMAKWFFLYWQDSNVVGVTFGQLKPVWAPWQLAAMSCFNSVVYYLWMGVCITGVVWVIRHRRTVYGSIWLPTLFLLYNTALFTFFPAWDRFRFPMMPLFTVFFGVGWCALYFRRRAKTGCLSTLPQNSV